LHATGTMEIDPGCVAALMEADTIAVGRSSLAGFQTCGMCEANISAWKTAP